MRSPRRFLFPVLLTLLATDLVLGREQPAATRDAPGSDRTQRQYTQTYRGIATVREIRGSDGPDLLVVDFYPVAAIGEVLPGERIRLALIAGLPAEVRPSPGDELPLEVARTYDQVGAQPPRLVNVSWRYEPAAQFQPQPIQLELVGNQAGKLLRLEVDARILTDGRQHLLSPGQSDRYTVVARKPWLQLEVELGERTLFTGKLPLAGARKFLLIFRDDQLDIVRSSAPPASSD